MKLATFVTAFAALQFAAIAVAAQPASSWRAGIASASVTPTTDMWMGGYAARTHASTGTVQDLYAKALALADAEGGRFVFITVDAIGVPRELRKRMESRLAQSYQLRPDEFVITASHTHSGPEFRAGRVPVEAPGGESASQAYLARLEETYHTLVGSALKASAPA